MNSVLNFVWANVKFFLMVIVLTPLGVAWFGLVLILTVLWGVLFKGMFVRSR